LSVHIDQFRAPTVQSWHVPRRLMSSAIRPSRITVHDDGTAVAWYGEDPLLRYESLALLLSRHELSETDIECDDVMPRSGVTLRRAAVSASKAG